MRIISIILNMMVLSFTVFAQDANPESRIVRVTFDAKALSWRVLVNKETNFVSISSVEIKNRINKLRLHLGDILIIYDVVIPALDSDGASGTRQWMFGYCQTNKVAVYVCAFKDKPKSWSNIRIYHWIAPFDDPRNIALSFYFCEGHLLGGGIEGYEKMVHAIEKETRRNVLILGSAYDMDSGFGSMEEPFEDKRAPLDAAIRKSGANEFLLNRIFITERSTSEDGPEWRGPAYRLAMWPVL